MAHPTRWKAGVALAIVAAVAAAPAQAADSPAAGDEYVLEIPGARQSENAGLGGDGKSTEGPGAPTDQLGIVGESDPPRSPISSATDAAAAAPPSLIAGIVVLAGLGIAGHELRRRGMLRRR